MSKSGVMVSRVCVRWFPAPRSGRDVRQRVTVTARDRSTSGKGTISGHSLLYEDLGYCSRIYRKALPDVFSVRSSQEKKYAEGYAITCYVLSCFPATRPCRKVESNHHLLPSASPPFAIAMDQFSASLAPPRASNPKNASSGTGQDASQASVTKR